MGSASSRTASRWRSGGHARPRLPEAEAWAIALTWRDQLRGCVRLETEPESTPNSIIPSFQWVTFVFNGNVGDGFQQVHDPLITAAYARAATLVWFILSCCEGYSGRENPQFWKRVFYELLYPTNFRPDPQSETKPKRPQLHMTDATAFFTDAKRPFPCVKLVAGEDSIDVMVERVFFGRLTCPDKKRDRQLWKILKRLQCEVCGTYWTRSIPVVIDEMRGENVATVFRELAQPKKREESDQAVRSLAIAPPMELHAVVLVDDILFCKYSKQLPRSDVEIRMPVGLWNSLLQDSLWQCLRPEDRSDDDPRVCVTRLSIALTGDVSYSFLANWCSALPHIRSIESVDLRPAQYNAPGAAASLASDWAWLGYAIFHPDAVSQSRLKRITVSMEIFTLADGIALRRMAQGNNLLGDVETSIASSCYIEGRVRASTTAWRNSERSTQPCHAFSSDAWVSLCVSTVAALECHDWVCVVIPGHDLSWIRRSDIIETRTRRPGRSRIEDLHIWAYSTDVEEGTITSLLGVLGGSLRTLDVNNHHAVPASIVGTILRLCPRLKSLRINHDGSFWANAELALAMSRLVELELRIGYVSTIGFAELQPLQAACLPHLKALRLLSYNDDSFAADEDSVITFLRHHRGLQYFHWTRGFDLRPSWVCEPYHTIHGESRKFQDKLECDTSNIFDRHLILKCRLAFLSVLDQSDQTTRSSFVGNDVVSRIFDYGLSTSMRTVFIARKLPNPNQPW